MTAFNPDLGRRLLHEAARKTASGLSRKRPSNLRLVGLGPTVEERSAGNGFAHELCGLPFSHAQGEPSARLAAQIPQEQAGGAQSRPPEVVYTMPKSV